MNPIFQNAAYTESRRILENVKRNLDNSLRARKMSEKDFYTWVKQQGMPEAKTERIRRWAKGQAQMSDHLAAVCLCSTFMGISPEQAMFGTLTVEQHREAQKRQHSPSSGTWT
jgi:ABC-type nitrate/sulfonate/bicarbonate transport system ATPase subunit